jgi:prephenate dehydrogenase
MPIQITLIGLGQIGSSAGLALSKQSEQILRVGYDCEHKIAKRAKEIGAIDKAENNLRAAVEKANLVLLTLPMDQIRETLEIIAPELREGAVVMETGPVKEVVAAWAAELLPSGRYYVGLTPVLNPIYLHSIDSGIDAARADLFASGLVVIVSPPGTSSGAEDGSRSNPIARSNNIIC